MLNKLILAVCLVSSAFATPTFRVRDIVSVTNVTQFDCPSTTSPNLTQSQLEAAMKDFAELFYTQKNLTGAFNKYVASNYIQHNADILDGRAAAISALSGLWSSNATTFVVGRVMVGPNYTTVHLKAVTQGQANYTVADMYRTQGSCVVEHWDVLQQMQVNTTNPHSYF